MKLNNLTPKEEKVIVHKGTEPPFSGEYDNFFKEGTYVCKRCGFPLYKSENKFNSGCGWPSFDSEIKWAVKKIPDPDRKRTEIVCANCGAHLGHVFLGEGFTPKNIRHCVNSISLKFILKENQEAAVFGGGCFWCIEAAFKNIRGVLEVVSGYAGGAKENPTYEDVSSGKTGHAEVVKINYDPKTVSYEDLLGIFFIIHDPTTLNQQGSDVGHQYRSIILYTSDKQKKSVEKYIEKLEKEKIYDRPIVTEIKPLIKFYPAEEYHQNFLTKHKEAPYCKVVISPKLKKLREKFKNFMR